MELRHLRYFAAVADALHFSRAAEQLHLTQPALSRQIRDLEDELGVRLLERHGTMTKLTPAGTRLRSHVDGILRAVEHAAQDARSVDQVLRFGHYGTLWVNFYAPALRTFARRQPHVRLEAIELTPTELIAALRRGDVDLALIGPVDAALTREFATRFLGRVDAMLALAGDHPLAKRRTLGLEELREQPWIAWDERSFPRRSGLLRDAARAAGFKPRIVHTVDSVASMFMQVATSRAVGYVLPMSRQLPHTGVVFARLKPPGIVFEMNAAWRKSDAGSDRLGMLAELLAGTHAKLAAG